MARVALDGVWKIYEQRGKAVEAVRDLTLDCADGEFLAIVGPSGCGKSSTMRMIAGLETISRGTITIGDRVVNGVKPADRNIAMVFENYALYPTSPSGRTSSSRSKCAESNRPRSRPCSIAPCPLWTLATSSSGSLVSYPAAKNSAWRLPGQLSGTPRF